MKLENIAIIAAIVYFFTRYQTGQVTYNIVRNYIKKWEYDGVTIYTEIEVKNGSDIPISVDGFEGDILYLGQNVAKVGLINKLDISPRSSRIITVGAKILYGPATAAILETIRAGRIESSLKLRGTLFAGRFKIPVSTTYDLW